MTTNAVRVQTILRQLEEAASQYTVAKDAFVAAQVEYEVARERFARTKDMAMAMIGPSEWMQWSEDHPDLEYTGTSLGDAITRMLNVHAWNLAYEYDPRSNRPFNPSMALETIAENLEAKGYEFNSATPLRETNAALMKLKGVIKTKHNTYQTEDSALILEFTTDDQPPIEDEAGVPIDDIDDLLF